MPATFQIQGAAELDQLLQELPVATAKRVLRSALMAGGTVVVKEAKSTAPVGVYTSHVPPGHQKFGPLASNIRRGVIKTAEWSMAVGVGISKAYWGSFQEFGTSRMAAHPWLRRAWESSKIAALQAFGKSLGTGIEREALRLAGLYRTKR